MSNWEKVPMCPKHKIRMSKSIYSFAWYCCYCVREVKSNEKEVKGDGKRE